LIKYFQKLLHPEFTDIYFSEKIKKKYKESYGDSFFINKFGHLNKNKIFYVIKRSPGGGIFSNLFFVLQHLYLIRNRKFIPIIDMKNFPNLYSEKFSCNKTSNAWEYYFKNLSSYNLSNVYSSSNVIVTSNQYFEFTKNTDQLRKIYFKNIKLQDFIKTKINLSKKKYQKIIKKGYIAVHFTTNTQKFAAKHPLPPTIYQISNILNSLKKNNSNSNIFLSTFVKNAKHKIIKRFKEIIFFNNFYSSNSVNVFNDRPRINHRFKCGLETIIDTYFLSWGKIVLASESNVIDFIKLISKKKKILLIDNGKNFRSFPLSRFYWYYKFIVINLFSFLKKDKLIKY